MAKFRAGALVGALSGSIHGITFAQSSSGPTIRSKAFPRRLADYWEIQQATNHAYVAKAWGELIEPHRIAWRRIASTLNTTDRLGRSRPMTGKELFIRYNTQCKMTVTGVATYPPNIYVTQPPYYFAAQFTASTSTYTVGALFAGGAAYQACAIWGCRPCKAHLVTRFRSWKLLAVVASSLLPFNIYSGWIPRLGAMQQGECYGVRLQALDPATLTSPPVQFVDLVQ